jgi:hypothetical protein
VRLTWAVEKYLRYVQGEADISPQGIPETLAQQE